jgi:glycosyltransferase involved in cell wall biosynthesis
MRILLVENGFNDLKKSRVPLGSYFQSLGNEVFYACPEPKEADIFNITMSRNSLAPIQLLDGFGRLSRLENENTVHVVLSFRFIPNVLNYLASFRNSGIKRVTVITGLGFAFISENNSIGAIVQRILIKLFYRLASRRVQIVAQNPDDLADLGIQNGKVVLGSGVERIDPKVNPVFHTDSLKLLYVGRLLKSKGINTTISTFEQLKLRNISVTLTIAGTIDKDNPDSLTESELSELKSKVGVNYLGFLSDMDSVYKECNVLLFPSTYREGVPRVILEALKQGLTIVTRDMPGCKETIDGNGYLIREEEGIDKAIEYLLSLDSKKIIENSIKSRELFESTFCADVIYPQYLSYLS